MNVPILRRQAEHGNWHAVASYAKWDDAEQLAGRRLHGLQADQLRRVLGPTSEGIWEEGNLLTTAGITRLLNLLIGAGGQAFDNAHCRLGVGDGTTAAATTDTDLSAAAGATHRYFNMADATYPQVSANVLTLQATFASGNGNFQWNEWGIDPGNAASTVVTAPLLNHKIPASSLGTKASGTVWAFVVTVTLT